MMSYQRDFEQRLRVAFIGVGSHAYRNLLPCATFLPIHLCAVCDLDEAKVKATAAQYGAKAFTDTEQMYRTEALDAVFIAVGPKHHPRLAKEAFSAGVHVWLEKPPAMRAAEVEDLMRAREDRVCVVGLKKIFAPSTEKALELSRLKDFGELQTILAVHPMAVPEHGEKILTEGVETPWLGNGVHGLSVPLLVGGPVEAVTVHRTKDGHGACILEFKSGVIGNYHLASAHFGQPLERCILFGSRMRVEIENSRRILAQRGIPFQYSQSTSYFGEGLNNGAVVWEPQNLLATLENKALFTQGMVQEMRYFCDCVLEERVAEKGSLEFALEIMRVYEAALLSDGRRVRIQRG